MSEQNENTEHTEVAGSGTWLRTAGRWLVRAITGLIVLVLLTVMIVLGVLQTRWGADQVRQIAVDQANQALNGELVIERLGGNFVTNLHVYGVSLFQNDDLMATVDTVNVSFRLLPLLKRTIRLPEVYIASPRFHAAQDDEGIWNYERLVDPAEEPDTTEFDWTIILDSFLLHDGASTVAFYSPAGDSVAAVDSLHLAVSDVRFGPDHMNASLDEILGIASPPGSTYPVQLFASGILDDQSFRVDALEFHSEHSNVSGRGTIPLNLETDLETLDFTLEAHPFDTNDLRTFMPALDVYGLVNLTVHLTSLNGLARADIDLEAGDGATLSMTGSAAVLESEEMAFKAEGMLRNLNPAYFTREDETDGLFNLEFDLDVKGPSSDRLSGATSVRLHDSRWTNRVIRESNLRASLTEGTIDLALETGIGQSILNLEAGGRWFDDEPTYAANGQFLNINIADFADDAEATSDIDGSFSLSGRSFDMEEATVSGSLRLAPSRYDEIYFGDGNLQFSLLDGQIDYRSSIEIASGVIDLAGQAQPFDDVVRYHVSRGSFQNLNMATLTGDTASVSNLNGQFTLAGEGSDPEDLFLEVSVEVRESAYGDIDDIAGQFSTRIQNGLVTFDAGVSLDGGTLQIEGRARPFDEPVTYAVTSGSFRDIDIGRLTDDPEQSSNLAGSFELQGEGTDMANMSLAAIFQIAPSTFNVVEIRSGVLDLRLTDGSAALEGALQSDAGEFHLAATSTVYGDQQPFEITEGRFAHINAGAWMGSEDLTTDINGRFMGSGTGVNVQTSDVNFRIDFEVSHINDEQIESGFISTVLSDGLLDFQAELDAESGELLASLTGRLFDDRPTYDFLAMARGFDVGNLAGNAALDTRLTFELTGSGAGFDSETLSLEGRLDGHESTLAGARLDTLVAAFELRDGFLHLDTLFMHSDVATLTAGGALGIFDNAAAQESYLRADLTILDLQPVAGAVGADYTFGEGTVAARISGTRDDMQFDVESDLRNVRYNEIRIGRLVANVAGEQQDGLNFYTRTRTENLSLPALVVERTNFDIIYSPEQVDFAGDLRIDRTRSGSFGGSVYVHDESQLLVLESVSLDLDQTRLQLLQEASISIVNNEYRVRNLLLFGAGQQIAVDGIIDLEGDQSLIVTIEQIEIEPFADLFQYTGLSGLVNAMLVMSGPAESPEISGSIEARDVVSFEDPVGDILVNIEYRDFILNLDAAITHDAGQQITAAGTIPMNLSLKESDMSPPSTEVDFSIDASDFPVNTLQPFLDPETVRDLDGLFTADINIRGTLEDPVLDGSVRFSDGRMSLPTIGTQYRDMLIAVRLEGNQAFLETAELRSGRGGISVAGSINLEELNLEQTELELDITMRRFQATNIEAYRITTAGNLELRGTYTSPVITGGIVIERAEFMLTDDMMGDVEDVQLTERDLQDLESRFGIRVTDADTTTFDFYEAMELDVGVRIERNVWLRSRANPRMNIELMGILEMQKEPFAEPLLFGEIQTTERSRIEQFGRRFDIRVGNLVFNGPMTDPIMDIEADLRIRSGTRGETEAVITLSLEGTLDNLQPELSSDPPMETTEIVSYIATGRPPEALFGGGDAGFLGGAEGLARGFVTGQFVNVVEGLAATELGLDVIDIQHDDTYGTTLTAGKYISNELFASISRPLSAQGTESIHQNTVYMLEYEAFRWLMFRLSRRQGVPGLELLWEYAY